MDCQVKAEYLSRNWIYRRRRRYSV